MLQFMEQMVNNFFRIQKSTNRLQHNEYIFLRFLPLVFRRRRRLYYADTSALKVFTMIKSHKFQIKVFTIYIVQNMYQIFII